MCESQCNIRGTKAVADQPSEMITLKEDIIASSQFDFLLIASPGWQTLGLLQKHRVAWASKWNNSYGCSVLVSTPTSIDSTCRPLAELVELRKPSKGKGPQSGTKLEACLLSVLFGFKTNPNGFNSKQRPLVELVELQKGPQSGTHVFCLLCFGFKTNTNPFN